MQALRYKSDSQKEGKEIVHKVGKELRNLSYCIKTKESTEQKGTKVGYRTWQLRKHNIEVENQLNIRTMLLRRQMNIT